MYGYIVKSSIKDIMFSFRREEFETDRCIYAGSVRDGVTTWREDAILLCNDTHFEFKHDHFNLKLRVKNGGVDVNLNRINLGSITSQTLSSSIARGGIFATSEGEILS